jgi:predicted TIM-barrel fold metal-dependent hydrolase
LERYPDIKFVISHAGGTMPYLAQRLEYTRIRSKAGFPHIEENTPKGILHYHQNLYYDTGLSYGDANFAFLEKFVGYKQILFGSDWPFGPEQWMTENVNAIANYFKGNKKILNAVQHDNAFELLNFVR